MRPHRQVHVVPVVENPVLDSARHTTRPHSRREPHELRFQRLQIVGLAARVERLLLGQSARPLTGSFALEPQ